jgi:hypothetical protein
MGEIYTDLEKKIELTYVTSLDELLEISKNVHSVSDLQIIIRNTIEKGYSLTDNDKSTNY